MIFWYGYGVHSKTGQVYVVYSDNLTAVGLIELLISYVKSNNNKHMVLTPPALIHTQVPSDFSLPPKP